MSELEARIVFGSEAYGQVAETRELRVAQAAIGAAPLDRHVALRLAAFALPAVMDDLDIRKSREGPREVEVQRGLGGARDEEKPYTWKRARGQLFKKLLGVSGADAMGLCGVGERLTFAEDARPSLLLAPSADDSHGQSMEDSEDARGTPPPGSKHCPWGQGKAREKRLYVACTSGDNRRASERATPAVYSLETSGGAIWHATAT